MNIKGILLAGLSFAAFTGVVAQDIEYDDMYFNAQDRAKLNATRAVAYNMDNQSKGFDYDKGNETANPTDSYTARNVNPEYTARARTQSAQAEEQDYFVDNYRYRSNEFNNWNNNYTNWYNSSWYRPNFYGPGINTWNSPYYGYSSWNSPWYDPYWSYNGWSSSFSFHFGRTWNYGWGGAYNYWNRPYYGWDPYGLAYGYGLGYGGGYWNNFRYPGTIIVVNKGENNGRKVVYGKRPTRSATVVDRNATRSRTADSFRESRNSSGSYNSSTNSRQADYYNRSRSSSNSTFYDRGATEQNRSRSSWGSGNDRYNSGGRSSYSTPSTPSPSYTPSTNSPSRSMGSGSSGRSRGRY